MSDSAGLGCARRLGPSDPPLELSQAKDIMREGSSLHAFAAADPTDHDLKLLDVA